MSRRVMLIKEYRAHNINHILGSAPWLSKGTKYIDMIFYLDEEERLVMVTTYNAK